MGSPISGTTSLPLLQDNPVHVRSGAKTKASFFSALCRIFFQRPSILPEVVMVVKPRRPKAHLR
ncbi:hypothetical protein M407DRAFT_131863 [Tulasnella calospora MUT 4182]|uniref:Uncharacterized protein n=1 Tax=Tulasnella calospora MUT 4182 TaxID=1051891 RepID=A0A0C3QA99_9AGAM|nr:hypothetical protein M407DRAFT_131863 [Tulasnella calospora MUT 4182]